MKKMRAVLVQRRSYVFLLISTLLVLVAGSLTIVWQVEQHYSTRADGSNVIGPPSLPSATVNTILTRAGSPMAGTGAVIEQAARQATLTTPSPSPSGGLRQTMGPPAWAGLITIPVACAPAPLTRQPQMAIPFIHPMQPVLATGSMS